MKKYRVIRDRQGGAFGTGRDLTVEGWREQAIAWAMADDWDEENIEFIKKMPAKNVMDYVGEVWDLDFGEVKQIKVKDKSKAEKVKVRKRSKSKVWELEYRYSDEDEFHNAYIVIYYTGEPLGDTIDHALELANEDDDWSGVDKLLGTVFGISDSDVCFYFEPRGITPIKKDIELDFDIVIKDMWVAIEPKNGC